MSKLSDIQGGWEEMCKKLDYIGDALTKAEQMICALRKENESLSAQISQQKEDLRKYEESAQLAIEQLQWMTPK